MCMGSHLGVENCLLAIRCANLSISTSRNIYEHYCANTIEYSPVVK